MTSSLGICDSDVGPLVPRDRPVDVEHVETMVDTIELDKCKNLGKRSKCELHEVSQDYISEKPGYIKLDTQYCKLRPQQMW